MSWFYMHIRKISCDPPPFSVIFIVPFITTINLGLRMSPQNMLSYVHEVTLSALIESIGKFKQIV